MDIVREFEKILRTMYHIEPYHHSLNIIPISEHDSSDRLSCCNKYFDSHFLQFDMIITQNVDIKNIEKINVLLNSSLTEILTMQSLLDSVVDDDSINVKRDRKETLPRSKSLNNETLRYHVLQPKPLMKKVEIKKGLYKRPHFDATFKLLQAAGILKNEEDLIYYRTDFDNVNLDFVEILPYSILKESLFSSWKEKDDIISIPSGRKGSILTVSILYPDISKVVSMMIKKDKSLVDTTSEISRMSDVHIATFIDILRKLK